MITPPLLLLIDRIERNGANLTTAFFPSVHKKFIRFSREKKIFQKSMAIQRDKQRRKGATSMLHNQMAPVDNDDDDSVFLIFL